MTQRRWLRAQQSRSRDRQRAATEAGNRRVARHPYIGEVAPDKERAALDGWLRRQVTIAATTGKAHTRGIASGKAE
jgi:hypothetical protein